MRGKIKLMLMAVLMMACSKEGVPEGGRGIDYVYGREIPHEMIVLGDRLENPYKTANVTKAVESLYPTKAGRVELQTTDLYVRFLPADDAEYELLEGLGLNLIDHPLDYDVVVEGDWYHDPEIPEGNMTWQYAVVPKEFKFPDVHYEIVDECYMPENDPSTKADGIDWEAVEMEAFRLTGNGDMIAPQTRAPKACPSGRITIVDDSANGGKPFGVAGVCVSCNTFVKFDTAYTDRDGYYSMEKTFSSNLRYRLVFKNEKGFSLGFNLVLVPASVSTLGKSGPEGVNITVTRESEDKLFRRCAVSNAAYDYYARCAPEDMDISLPPSDIRIWLFNSMEASSAVMLHHGALVSNDLVTEYLGKFASLLTALLPDITLGTDGREDYASLYNVTCHELAHASHFTKVGKVFWNSYIRYIIESYVRSGEMTYGDGSAAGAGYCEVGEMWAYYLESKMYKDRYGGNFPTFGNSHWFHPQIFRYLDERGISCSDIFSVLDADVNSKETLRTALSDAFPEKTSVIEQVFSRY